MLFYRNINSTINTILFQIWEALHKVTQPWIWCSFPCGLLISHDHTGTPVHCALSMPTVCEVEVKWPLGDWANPLLWAAGFPVKLVTCRPLTCRGPCRAIPNMLADENHLSAISFNKLKWILEEDNQLFNNIHSRPWHCSHKHPVKTFIASQNRCHVQLISWNLTGEIPIPWDLKLLTFPVFSNN